MRDTGGGHEGEEEEGGKDKKARISSVAGVDNTSVFGPWSALSLATRGYHFPRRRLIGASLSLFSILQGMGACSTGIDMQCYADSGNCSPYTSFFISTIEAYNP